MAPRSEAAEGTHGVHIPHAQVEEVLRGQQARVGSGQSAGADLGGWGRGRQRGAEKSTPADKAADAHRVTDCTDRMQSAHGVAHVFVEELHMRVRAERSQPDRLAARPFHGCGA